MVDTIRKILLASKKVAIIPHINPDWDAVGSAFALREFLHNKGICADVYFEKTLDSSMTFLGAEYIVGIKDSEGVRYDAVVAVDCGDRGRLGETVKIFDDCETTINIDHHVTNTNFAKYNLVNPDAAATGEILADMLKGDLTLKIAQYLYVAISTDSGNFRYSNTTAKTHRTVADLLDLGVDVSEISTQIYDNISLSELKITQAAISSLRLLFDGRLSIMSISEKDMEEAGATEEELTNIASLPIRIKGAQISALLKERADSVKVSLRSKNDTDVCEIASHFGGGGHKKASGYTTVGTIEKAIKELSDYIERNNKLV